MATDRAARREAKLERLLLAASDMADAAAAARILRRPYKEQREPLHFRARRALETGMYVSYARAFNASKGDPPLPKAPTSGLSPSERKVHQWALDERNMVWAHIDRGNQRRTVDAVAGDPEAGLPVGFVENWNPPTPEESTRSRRLRSRSRSGTGKRLRRSGENCSGRRQRSNGERSGACPSRTGRHWPPRTRTLCRQYGRQKRPAW